MFAVLGATGNTGKVVADTLLAQGTAVRAVVRDAADGQTLKDKGAEFTVADVEDRTALEQACRLWRVDIATCEMVLEQLVQDRFLRKTNNGPYVVR